MTIKDVLLAKGQAIGEGTGQAKLIASLVEEGTFSVDVGLARIKALIERGEISEQDAAPFIARISGKQG